MADEQKKCRRNGCLKKYLEVDNVADCCDFHPGKPLFHDLKKGWTCCNKIVHDWDEFEKIPKCAKGQHSDTDPNQGLVGQDTFFRSDTVSNAKKAEDNSQQRQQVKINKISDFNKKEEQDEKQKQEELAQKEQTPVVKDGKHKCTHKGCQKSYAPEDNEEGSCNFHPGEPVFHDLKKYWTCCKKETYDWDDFMKLPTCAQGQHVPKMEFV